MDKEINVIDLGFDVSVNDMIQEKHYVFSFQDSNYEIYKNTLDELLLKEI